MEIDASFCLALTNGCGTSNKVEIKDFKIRVQCSELDSSAMPFRRRRFNDAVSAMDILAIRQDTFDGSTSYILFQKILGLVLRLRFSFRASKHPL